MNATVCLRVRVGLPEPALGSPMAVCVAVVPLAMRSLCVPLCQFDFSLQVVTRMKGKGQKTSRRAGLSIWEPGVKLGGSPRAFSATFPGSGMHAWGVPRRAGFAKMGQAEPKTSLAQLARQMQKVALPQGRPRDTSTCWDGPLMIKSFTLLKMTAFMQTFPIRSLVPQFTLRCSTCQVPLLDGNIKDDINVSTGTSSFQNTEDDGTNERDLQAFNGRTRVCPRVCRRCLRAPARPLSHGGPGQTQQNFQKQFPLPQHNLLPTNCCPPAT